MSCWLDLAIGLAVLDGINQKNQTFHRMISLADRQSGDRIEVDLR